MKHPATLAHESYPDTHQDVYSKTVFGFWVYLLTDFMMFATLFAAYIVLQNSTYGGPSGKELFDLPLILVQTLILLTCSLTSGLAGAMAHRNRKQGVTVLLSLTFLLGMAFLGIELADFKRLMISGNSWERSAFLSAYFTLIGTHGLHMVFALLWIPVLLWPVWCEGLTTVSVRRLTCLRIFWQFLNIVWIFIFSMIYLMGAIV